MQAAIGDLFEMTSPAAEPGLKQAILGRDDRAERRFDYGSATASDIEAAKAHAAWVREAYGALEARTLETMAEIGERLLQAREAVGHGHFMKWVQSECGVSHSTANRMMSLAKNFAPDEIRLVTNLPRELIYEVAADTTPAKIRDDFKAKVAAGETIWDGSLMSSIKEARLRAKKAKARQASKPAPKTKAQEAREKRDAEQRERDLATRRALDEQIEETAGVVIGRLSDNELSKLATLIRTNRWEVGQALAKQIHAAIEALPFNKSELDDALAG